MSLEREMWKMIYFCVRQYYQNNWYSMLQFVLFLGCLKNNIRIKETFFRYSRYSFACELDILLHVSLKIWDGRNIHVFNTNTFIDMKNVYHVCASYFSS